MVTLLVAAGALALCAGPERAQGPGPQVLTVLPTAALPLATGGDDMPIVALLLLGHGAGPAAPTRVVGVRARDRVAP